MQIVFFGGSFDPIHKIHQFIIEDLKSKYDKVIIIPTAKSGNKQFKTSNEHRLAMLRLVTDCEISEIEISQKESFTIDTMEYFQKKYPKDTLYFAIGADQYNLLSTWKNIEKLKNIVNFIVYSRNGEIHENIIDNNISSTKIREGDLTDVDTKVREYIKKHRLYKAK